MKKSQKKSLVDLLKRLGRIESRAWQRTLRRWNTHCATEYLRPKACVIRNDLFYRFYKYRAEATDVADFLKKYYKADRYTGRGADYAQSLLASYQREFDKNGYCFISHHDSKIGEYVSFYGNNI